MNQLFSSNKTKQKHTSFKLISLNESYLTPFEVFNICLKTRGNIRNNIHNKLATGWKGKLNLFSQGIIKLY